MKHHFIRYGVVKVYKKVYYTIEADSEDQAIEIAKSQDFYEVDNGTNDVDIIDEDLVDYWDENKIGEIPVPTDEIVVIKEDINEDDFLNGNKVLSKFSLMDLETNEIYDNMVSVWDNIPGNVMRQVKLKAILE